MFRQIVEPVRAGAAFSPQTSDTAQIDGLSARLRNARRCVPSENLTCSTSGCIGTEKVSG
jgi:hypothetical protein